MRPKLAITLDRNPQYTRLLHRGMSNTIILRINFAFSTSEDKFFTFFRIARHVLF